MVLLKPADKFVHVCVSVLLFFFKILIIMQYDGYYKVKVAPFDLAFLS